MTSSRPVLSVVAPVFNEGGGVAELVQRVVRSCRGLGVPFEMLVINDGSSDQTLQTLVSMSRDILELRVVDLFRNFGHMSTLSAGLALARGDAVVVMDGDLQDPPEILPQFFAEWCSGADVVYGLRTRRGESWPKRVAIALFYWLLEKTAHPPIPKQVGTFCLMDRRVVDVLNSMRERHRYFAGLRAWVGGKQSFVPYERPDRHHGKSRVGLLGLVRLALTGLLSFSSAPLRYASLLAILCGLGLLLIGVTAILVRLFTNLAIPGWATFTALIGLTGFVQALVLAVISEYIAVVFDEIKARPLFLVRGEFAHGKRVPEEKAS
ncbi:MAG: glycosyltransferase family 2 protein [Dehalococcoidia bacterium]|nr:glycosyltransferase family 2 protein [Dehalococcoidia bacterium]